MYIELDGTFTLRKTQVFETTIFVTTSFLSSQVPWNSNQSKNQTKMPSSSGNKSRNTSGDFHIRFFFWVTWGYITSLNTIRIRFLILLQYLWNISVCSQLKFERIGGGIGELEIKNWSHDRVSRMVR